jgi:hypothetical protein
MDIGAIAVDFLLVIKISRSARDKFALMTYVPFGRVSHVLIQLRGQNTVHIIQQNRPTSKMKLHPAGIPIKRCNTKTGV